MHIFPRINFKIVDESTVFHLAHLLFHLFSVDDDEPRSIWFIIDGECGVYSII